MHRSMRGGTIRLVGLGYNSPPMSSGPACVYTRTGDEGETGLLYGGRVAKDDPRCEAYGCVDEAVSTMGFARALCADERVKRVLLTTQRELFTVGAELATDPDDYDKLLKHFDVTRPEMVDRLESIIDEMNAELRLPRAFIVPGASAGSAALDLARSTLRRAERRVVALHRSRPSPNTAVLRYLNRLADLLFVLARYEDRALPIELTTGEAPQ